MAQNPVSTGQEYVLKVTSPRTVGEVAHNIYAHALPEYKATHKESDVVDALIDSHHLKVPKGAKKSALKFKTDDKIFVGQFIDPDHGQAQGTLSRLWDRVFGDSTLDTLADIRDEFLFNHQANVGGTVSKGKNPTVRATSKPAVPKFQWPQADEMAYLKSKTDFPKKHDVGNADINYGRVAFLIREKYPTLTNYELQKLLVKEFQEPAQGKTVDLTTFFKKYPGETVSAELPKTYTLGNRDTSFVNLSKQLKPHFPTLKREYIQQMLENFYGRPVYGARLDMDSLVDKLTGEDRKHQVGAPQAPIDVKIVKGYIAQSVQGLQHKDTIEKIMLAQAMQESEWIPNRQSAAGAVGLFQQMEGPALQYGLAINAKTDERLDPAKSALAGARQLNDLLTENNGNIGLALQKYNGGNKNFESLESRQYAFMIQHMMDNGLAHNTNPKWDEARHVKKQAGKAFVIAEAEAQKAKAEAEKAKAEQTKALAAAQATKTKAASTPTVLAALSKPVIAQKPVNVGKQPKTELQKAPVIAQATKTKPNPSEQLMTKLPKPVTVTKPLTVAQKQKP